MPYIKYKTFSLDSRPCYKCGREIAKGDFNWLYNTQKVAMFSHRNCLLSEDQFKEQMNKVETPVSPKTEEKTSEKPKLDLFEPKPPRMFTNDITDLITLTGKHTQTKTIKKLLRKRQYPFLFGSPGAGKTHLALSLAFDMSIDCIVISLSNDMFKSEILGSVSPVSGNFYATAFYHAWRKGGLVVFDECALASGAFMSVLNAALAQKELRFPNGERFTMHEHCFIMFLDNSAGYGNDPLFPERQDLGTAFRDRVAYVKFEYDTNLESDILVSIFNGDEPRATRWHTTVLSMRHELTALDVPVFASPRFAYAAAAMFVDSTFTYSEVISMYLMRGLNGDIQRLCDPIINRYARTY